MSQWAIVLQIVSEVGYIKGKDKYAIQAEIIVDVNLQNHAHNEHNSLIQR